MKQESVISFDWNVIGKAVGKTSEEYLDSLEALLTKIGDSTLVVGPAFLLEALELKLPSCSNYSAPLSDGKDFVNQAEKYFIDQSQIPGTEIYNLQRAVQSTREKFRHNMYTWRVGQVEKRPRIAQICETFIGIIMENHRGNGPRPYQGIPITWAFACLAEKLNHGKKIALKENVVPYFQTACGYLSEAPAGGSLSRVLLRYAELVLGASEPIKSKGDHVDCELLSQYLFGFPYGGQARERYRPG